MGTSSFRDLHAYRYAVALADRLHAEAVRWESFDRWSLHETEHWILRARERGLLADGYERELAEIARTLNGLMKRPLPGR